MGVWNETCGLSNLHINGGEKAMCFFILEKERQEDAFYDSAREYNPIIFPVVGTYDEYGCLDDIEKSLSLKLNLEYFDYLDKEGLLQIKEDEYESDDLTSFENIVKIVERARMKIGGRGVQLIYFIPEIYKAFVNEIGSRPCYDVEWNVREDYTRLAREELGNLEKYKKLEKELEKFEKKTDLLNTFFTPTRFGRSFDGEDDNFGYTKWFLIKFSQTSSEGMLNIMIDLKLFECALSISRKFWHPTTGKGSQNEEMMTHKILAEKILEIFKKRKSQYMIENKEELDDENMDDYGRESHFALSEEDK